MSGQDTAWCARLHYACTVHFCAAASQSTLTAVHSFATANVPVQGKKDTKTNARDVSASVIRNETIWQYGSGKTTTAILKALPKGTKLCSLLLPAYGNHTCAPQRTDQHMQGPGLALVDFSSWHKMLISGCAAGDKLQKGAQGLCSKRCFKCS